MAKGCGAFETLGERMKKLFVFLFLFFIFNSASAEETAGDAKSEEGLVFLTQILKAEKHFSNLEYDQAIAIDEPLLNQAKNNAHRAIILMTLSSAYLEKGIMNLESQTDDPNFKKALLYAAQCLEVDPAAWRAIANTAVVYMKTGNLYLADVNFERAKQFANPDSPYYLQMLSYQRYVQMLIEEEKKKEESNAAPV